MERGAHPRTSLLVAAGLALPVLVLSREILFGGKAWLDFDFLLSYGPRYEFLREGLRSGAVPLWSDAYLGGFPIAFSEFGWFYPVTWLFLLALPMPLAYHAQAALGLLLAGLAAYWLGRTWRLSRTAAFMSAYLYAFGPLVFSSSRFLNYADIYFALPASIACIERLGRGRRAYLPLLGVIFAITALAGHPQIAVMFGLAILLFGLFRIYWTYRDAGRLEAAKVGAMLALALAVGLAAAAPRLLPVFAVTQESTRAGGLDF